MVGESPTSVAIGDLDGDGNSDLAVTNQNSDNVSVLLGNGDGTFQAAVNYEADDHPKSVAIGDLDDDGNPDLAVANYSSDNVSVLLGNGDGTFYYPFPATCGAGNGPHSVAIGDLDGDGHQDLAVANLYDDNVSILRGNGDGTFQTAMNFGAGDSPNSVAIGNLDGDSNPDLAVTNRQSDNVSVLLGNGDGTFQAAENYGVGDYPASVTIGDLDGHGGLDLAVAIHYGDNVSVLLGNGDGTFQAPVQYAVDDGPVSVAIGDLDGDSNLDLAVANEDSDNVSVLLSNGDGTFQEALNFTVGSWPGSVAIGDLDGGGNPDLAVANWANDNVSVLLDSVDGEGTFQDAVNYGVGSSPRSVDIGDLDGDGNPDLAVANEDSNNVSVLRGNGDGTFQATVNYGTGNNPYSVAIGDLDGDGNPDLAVANEGSDNVSVLLGDGDGTFQGDVLYGVGDSPRSVAIDDLDGDGKLDLALACHGSWHNYIGRVSILLGNGDGTFQTAVNYVVGNDSFSVAIGDLDGDSNLDLAVANAFDDYAGWGDVSVLLGNGDGTFQAAVSYWAGEDPQSVAIGDLDGDGFPDLATVNLGFYYIDDGDVSVLLGNGDGTFQTAVSYAVGIYPIYPRAVAIGNLDDDSHPDLAVANGSSNSLSVLLGNGDGTFQTFVNYWTGDGPVSVAIGDLDGDSNLDLAVANEDSDNISVLMNASSTLTFLVDDDAPNDPGPGDPSVSDPLEDGSADHPYDAIQEGIDASSDGDTVIVTDGIYTGPGNRDIDFLGKAIAVRSENGPDNCVIDCQGSEAEPHRAFYFHSSEGTDSIVDGFTIQNGYGYYPGGGAILCEALPDEPGANPTITNNIITGCQADEFGGGIAARYSAPMVSNNTIQGNDAVSWGGGASFYGYVVDGMPVVDSNIFTDNHAGSTGGGLQLYVDTGYVNEALVTNNLFLNNSADLSGGGMICSFGSIPTIDHNTFTGNSAVLAGGGICLNSDAAISNTILWDNSAPSGNEILVYMGSSTIDCSDVEGGLGYVHFEDGTLDWGENMIDVDPLFCDPSSGDYRVHPSSPCAPGSQPVCGLIGAFDVCDLTIDVTLACMPDGGTLPLDMYFVVSLFNNNPEYSRRFAGQIDVLTAGGLSIQNWRSGVVTLGDYVTRILFETLPMHPTLIGTNTFTLIGEDITPAPYNQPPYPPSGDTDTDNCTVTGIAP